MMPPSPSHFLCIPIHYSPQLAASLASFRADVTSQLSFGFPDDAVRPLGTMHLTLGVMTLQYDETSSERIARRNVPGGKTDSGGPTLGQALSLLKQIKLNDVLKDAKSKAIRARKFGGQAQAESDEHQWSKEEEDKLKITLKGLRAIGPADKASVLYAPPVDSDGVLYRFCEAVKRLFQDAGMMDAEFRPLLLHATVVNTIYVRQRTDCGSGPRVRARRGGKQKMTIDARQVVDRYEDYNWMEDSVVPGVDLCRMGADKGEDGEVKYFIEGRAEF